MIPLDSLTIGYLMLDDSLGFPYLEIDQFGGFTIKGIHKFGNFTLIEHSHKGIHKGGAAEGRPSLCGGGRRPPPLWLCSYVSMWLCGYVAM